MLTPKQRQFLKAQAHQLKPAMHVGKSGITQSLTQELDIMLESLELMKLKLNQNSSENEGSVIKALQDRVDGLEHVWTIGHTVLVFRASRNKPTSYPLPTVVPKGSVPAQ